MKKFNYDEALIEQVRLIKNSNNIKREQPSETINTPSAIIYDELNISYPFSFIQQ